MHFPSKHAAFTLVEVMIALLAFSFLIAIFGAMYPLGMRLNNDAKLRAEAVTIAQKTMDEVRFAGFGNLTYSGLVAYGVIDTSKASTPFSITSADGNNSPASRLPNGTGTLVVSDVAFDLKKVLVSISWRSSSGATTSLVVSTVIANL